jgi:glucokinase
VQAHALAQFFDEVINTFSPDAPIMGGGALETAEEFQRWFMHSGDTAGARGAAIEALKNARENPLWK